MKNMKKKSLLVLFAVLVMAGCQSYKKIPYLQDSTYTTTQALTYDARIMPNDLLTITVNTSDKEAGIPFHLLYPTSSITGGSTTGAQSLQKYLVDNEGYINFPTVGMILVKGKTRREAEEQILKSIGSNLDRKSVV